MKKKSSTLTRIITAVIAVGVMAVSFHLWRDQGILYIALLAVLGLQIEFAQMVLFRRIGLFPSVFFVACVATSLLSAVFWGAAFSIVFGVLSLLFLVNLLFHPRLRNDLHELFMAEALSGLGFIYCGVFPSMALQLLNLKQGLEWFLTLLAVVFAGDIFAYFVGRKLKGPKVWELVSPRKTWAGVWGGLVGSVITGAIARELYFPQVPFLLALGVSAFAGIIAQVGDFFESILKRVAGQKDSGTLLPGHGGFMDRIDGVVFAAPLFYFLAWFNQTYFS